jgi:hypothetical protein
MQGTVHQLSLPQMKTTRSGAYSTRAHQLNCTTYEIYIKCLRLPNVKTILTSTQKFTPRVRHLRITTNEVYIN